MSDGRSTPDQPELDTAAEHPPVVSEALGWAATVNDENPWPGLLSFREADQEYFEGRRTETDDLFRLVMRERLTVLFAVSGLGKSSLLQAGLFPLLRRDALLPIYVRLDFAAKAPDLVAQVKASIARQAAGADIDPPRCAPDERLWEYLHRQDAEFWTRRNRLVMPVLVFDQFEEIFTLGRLDNLRAQATERFLEEFADLAEGRPPAALKSLLDARPQDARRFSFTRHPYKLLVSIREDFLPELEDLRERMPSVAMNRLRLQRMNGIAALRVVARARHLIDPDVAEKVVRFVAADKGGAPLNSLEVEPALLSVVCRELNNTRQRLHEAKISETLLEGNRDEVLNDFYERTVGDLPVAVRSFVEERLITASGFRDSVAVENAVSVAGITPEHITMLVERRLLRREERGGVQRIELTHDLLTGVVRASRDRRRRQEEAERERATLVAEQERERRRLHEQREQEDQERAARDLKRTRLAASIFAMLLLAAIVALVLAVRSRQALQRQGLELQHATAEERQSRTVAERQSEYASAQRRIAEEALGRIQQSLLIRQAALSGDDTKLNDLVARLEHTDSIQFGAVATDQHYRSAGNDIYRFELFPHLETLPAENAVAFITYLANHPTFQNTLLTAGQSRGFRVTYTGWGCLHRIVALTEYTDPTKAPTVTVFDMCKELGGGWGR